MAKLVFNELDGSERTFALSGRTRVLIGRDLRSDIVLQDPRVSRRHAEIIVQHGTCHFRDLSSANGSFIDGKRATEAVLRDGIRIGIGSTVIKYSDSDDTFATISTVLPDMRSEEPQDVLPEVRERAAFATLRPEVDEAGEEPGDRSERAPAELNLPRYVLDVSDRNDGRNAVCDPAGRVLLYYQRPRSFIASAAILIVWAIALTGSAAGLFLAMASSCFAALLVVILTAGFVGMIRKILPRASVLLCEDSTLRRVVLFLEHQPAAVFLGRTFLVRNSEGTTLAVLHKRRFAFRARRWRMIHPLTGFVIGNVTEELVKPAPDVTAASRENLKMFRIRLGPSEVGSLVPDTYIRAQYVLDLEPSTAQELGPPLVALAVLVLTHDAK